MNSVPPIILSDANFLVASANKLVTNGEISLGNLSDDVCFTMVMKSSMAIGKNLLLKITDSGGEPRVTLTDNFDNVCVGVSLNSTTDQDQDVKVCVGGMFTAVIEEGFTISIGDPLLISSFHFGRVDNNTGLGLDGTVGVAISSGTGDAAGTVTVKGLFNKNEVF